MKELGSKIYNFLNETIIDLKKSEKAKDKETEQKQGWLRKKTF